ncbi:hypothetical protein B7R21_11660 [Subtercola boreus]|uniref:DUF4352 domain-containing protein n=1 Tax=Subtercola boreus TaxID=120213 RepID=A0A3E0VRF7_9MICO|nr:hypothetical protein [Subtercola boreus]RFA11983.1 hypothetical protein B7R21_11660 [Subtercola boreus]
MVATTLTLAGCASAGAVPSAADAAGSLSGSRSATKSPTPTPTAQPWAEVTDGTWTPISRAVALGQPASSNPFAYSVTVTGVPTLTILGDRVTMTSPVSITHTQDDLTRNTVAYATHPIWTPGNLNYPEHDEAYGTHPDMKCAAEKIAVGETTTCTVAFTAPPREIQNSYWQFVGVDSAAWPSQPGRN